MPLHVAARAGQMHQLELLIVYGADPGALDKQGNSPASCARLIIVFFYSLSQILFY